MTSVQEFIDSWLSHRKVLHQLLADVTTEELSMKPWDNAMSLSQLVLHIAGAMDMFVLTVQNGAFTQAAPPEAFETADELRAQMAERTQATEAALRALTAEQLAASIAAFGRSSTGGALLQQAKDHEIHHKGQLFVYLRLAGHEKLPFFTYREA